MPRANFNFEIPPHLKREFVFQTAGILPPNGILFGFHTLFKAGEQAKKLGARRGILVTDERMVQLGYVEAVTESLQEAGLQIEVFPEVKPEPHFETAVALYDLMRPNNFDFVIGLGGGSPMDMAKLAAVLGTHEKKPLEIIRQRSVIQPTLKKILIPTTSGTGSEVSRSLLISADKEKYVLSSPYLFPEIAIVDPGLTLSAPPSVTASTGIDALAHAVDSVMSKWATPINDSLGLGGISLLAKYLRRAVFNGQDMEARYYLSLAATMSMMAMTGIGGALYSHGISYVLALFQPIPHGVGCGVPLPYTMAFNLPMIEEKLARIARAMGEPVESLSPRAAGCLAVQGVYDLIADVKMPLSLQKLGFRYEDIPQMVEACLNKFPRPNNPRPMSKEGSRALFEAMWEGKIPTFL